MRDLLGLISQVSLLTAPPHWRLPMSAILRLSECFIVQTVYSRFTSTPQGKEEFVFEFRDIREPVLSQTAAYRRLEASSGRIKA